MKPTLVIPATTEASSEYRLAQSKTNLKREGQLKDIGRGFRRGLPLDPTSCLMTTPINGWTPPNPLQLAQVVPEGEQAQINKLFSINGLAATIAMTDTVAGVTELIEYDENEQIVKPLVEPEDDRSNG